MRHLLSGIALTLCAALAADTAFAVRTDTNAVVEVGLKDAFSPRFATKVIRLTGTIRDVIDDDLDVRYHFIVLNAD